MGKCKGAARLRSFYLRWRKEGFGGIGYSVSTMNDDLQISETNVESLLKAEPNAIRFFLNWKLGCVGCGFARFCTLGDVVKTYHLDEHKFLEEAQKLVVQQS
jgi:hypothetical protein